MSFSFPHHYHIYITFTIKRHFLRWLFIFFLSSLHVYINRQISLSRKSIYDWNVQFLQEIIIFLTDQIAVYFCPRGKKCGAGIEYLEKHFLITFLTLLLKKTQSRWVLCVVVLCVNVHCNKVKFYNLRDISCLEERKRRRTRKRREATFSLN